MTLLECPQCHKIFERTHGSQKFCTKECQRVFDKNIANMKAEAVKRNRKILCRYCGAPFKPEIQNQRYCCEEHKALAHKIMDAEKKEQRKQLKEAKRLALLKKSTIDDVNKRARESGMNYGDYVAEETKKMTKIVRKW